MSLENSDWAKSKYSDRSVQITGVNGQDEVNTKLTITHCEEETGRICPPDCPIRVIYEASKD